MKQSAKTGSTIAEVSLLGALVLLVTIALWFMLGNGLQQFFTLLKQDMLAQSSQAQAVSFEQFQKTIKAPPAIEEGKLINTETDKQPITTAGSNGNRKHIKTYKALESLIDRSIQKKTLTEAQADTVKSLVDQLLRIKDIKDIILAAERTSGPDTPNMEVQFEGKTYFATKLAATVGMEWSNEYSTFDTLESEKGEWGVYFSLCDQAFENGSLDDPDIQAFVRNLANEV